MNKLILVTSFIVGMTAISADADNRAVYGRDGGVEYATVISATPVIRSVAITVPRQECSQPGAAINSSALPAARLFAASVNGASNEPCRITLATQYEERIDGYDVTYRYNGKVYQTRMPYDPGRRVPVRVDSRQLRD